MADQTPACSALVLCPYGFCVALTPRAAVPESVFVLVHFSKRYTDKALHPISVCIRSSMPGTDFALLR